MVNKELVYQMTAIDALIPYVNNSRTHSDSQIAQIASSIKEFGFINPIIISEDGDIVAGHGRVLAARKLGLKELPCIVESHLTDAQRKAYVIADNQLALNAGWDFDVLKIELEKLQDEDFDLDLLGFDNLDELLGDNELTDAGGDGEDARGSLSDRFLVVPTTVFNAREGWWQDRKKAWIAMGINSEIGRADELAYSKSCQAPQTYAAKEEYEKKHGPISWDDFLQTDEAKSLPTFSGTSIFDPVLCEIAYRWFSPVGGTIIDPFAGGSVRGIVASKLGRQYIGCDLRAEQVEANRAQGEQICDDPQPVWIATDSMLIDSVCGDVKADLVFTCPPYADLEVYSDDPKDISTMPYDQFLAAYREIIHKSCSLLKQDRFACIVVGDVRDKKGNYYNFVGDTVQAFKDAGLSYYNEAVLLTQVGSVATRLGRQFPASRKLGKTHQNVLVFVKGDGKKAAQACGDIEIDESLLDEYQDADE